MLLAGGVAILPVTALLLKARGEHGRCRRAIRWRCWRCRSRSPSRWGLVAAAGDREEWFFPASVVIVGAHYLPFTFLYGMPLFAVLGGVMTLGGIALARWVPNTFATGGWVTGVLLLTFTILLRRSHRQTDSNLGNDPEAEGAGR